MPKKRNYSYEDANLLRILKEKADQYGELTVRKQDIMLEYGLSYQSVTESMNRLKEKWYIDFKRNNNGQKGSDFSIWLGESRKRDEPQEQDKQEPPTSETPSTMSVPMRGRTCKRCLTVAPYAEAEFCWKCGASLLTEKELLRREYQDMIQKASREFSDARFCNQFMATMGRVAKLAFEEEEKHAI